MGASFAMNQVPATTLAQIGDKVTLTGARNVTLTPNSTDNMTTSVQAGASGGKVGLAPAVALSLADEHDDVFAGSGGDAGLSGNFNATATHTGSTSSTADGSAAGGKAAVGAAIAITVGNDVTTASVGKFGDSGGHVHAERVEHGFRAVRRRRPVRSGGSSDPSQNGPDRQQRAQGQISGQLTATDPNASK